MCVQCLWKPEGSIGSPDLSNSHLWAAMWVLGAEPKSSGRAATTHNCSAVSPAQRLSHPVSLPSPPLPSPSYMALWHRLWLSKGKCFLASSDSLTILLSGGKVFEFEHELWPVFSGHPLYHEQNNLVKETSNDTSFRRLGNLNLSLWVDSLSFNMFWGAGM